MLAPSRTRPRGLLSRGSLMGVGLLAAATAWAPAAVADDDAVPPRGDEPTVDPQAEARTASAPVNEVGATDLAEADAPLVPDFGTGKGVDFQVGTDEQVPDDLALSGAAFTLTDIHSGLTATCVSDVHGRCSVHPAATLDAEAGASSISVPYGTYAITQTEATPGLAITTAPLGAVTLCNPAAAALCLPWPAGLDVHNESMFRRGLEVMVVDAETGAPVAGAAYHFAGPAYPALPASLGEAAAGTLAAAKAGNGNPGNSNPGDGDSGNGNPGNSNPDNNNPDNGDSGNNNPGNNNPDNGDSGNSNPGNNNPGNNDPGNGDDDSGDGDSGNGGSGDDDSGDGGSGDGGSGDGGSGDGGSGDGGSGDGGSGDDSGDGGDGSGDDPDGDLDGSDGDGTRGDDVEEPEDGEDGDSEDTDPGDGDTGGQESDAGRFDLGTAVSDADGRVFRAGWFVPSDDYELDAVGSPPAGYEPDQLVALALTTPAGTAGTAFSTTRALVPVTVPQVPVTVPEVPDVPAAPVPGGGEGAPGGTGAAPAPSPDTRTVGGSAQGGAPATGSRAAGPRGNSETTATGEPRRNGTPRTGAFAAEAPTSSWGSGSPVGAAVDDSPELQTVADSATYAGLGFLFLVVVLVGFTLVRRRARRHG